MESKGCSRRGASGGARLRPTFRITLGSIALDLARDGGVRTEAGREYRDLRSFLADAHVPSDVKGGAR